LKFATALLPELAVEVPESPNEDCVLLWTIEEAEIHGFGMLGSFVACST
jgi:hypothetical protein